MKAEWASVRYKWCRIKVKRTSGSFYCVAESNEKKLFATTGYQPACVLIELLPVRTRLDCGLRGNHWVKKLHIVICICESNSIAHFLCRQCQTKNPTGFHQWHTEGKSLWVCMQMYLLSIVITKLKKAVRWVAFSVLSVTLPATPGGRGGDVSKPWSVRVCERCFRFNGLQPRRPEERDGAAGAG